MNNLTTVGRIIYGIPMIVFGIMHFAFAPMMAGMVPTWVPGGAIWVYLTGIALILGALAVITNFRGLGFYGALGLALLMFTFALTIHLPALAAGDQAAMSSLLKDVMLGSGGLLIAGLLAPTNTPQMQTA